MLKGFLTDEVSRTCKGDVLELRKKTSLRNALLLVACAPFLMALKCSKEEEADTSSGGGTPSTPTQYLYINSTTGCYGGGVATSTAAAANTIVRYNLSTGAFDKVVANYTSGSTTDYPVAIMAAPSEDQIAVLVENTVGRRIDLVDRSNGSIVPYVVNGTALSAAVVAGIKLSNDSFLVSKTTAAERVDAPNIRYTAGAGNPWINAPAGNCATSTTLIRAFVELANGKLIFAHAGTTPDNKLGIISANGYGSASDCLNGTSIAAPTTTALPTSMILHSSGKLLVAYGSTTVASNSIYAYDVDATANTVTLPVNAYSNTGIINGPSAIVEDPTTRAVYVANALSTMNTIEKFTFDSTSKTLTRVGSSPFINSNLFTRCINSMFVGD
jgi:hypothetical protein